MGCALAAKPLGNSKGELSYENNKKYIDCPFQHITD